jgi:hypothetical protein
VEFELVGGIRDIEVIATGRAIRVLPRLVRELGQADWRKMKGIATVRLETGDRVEAERHGYEAHGVGKRKMKIKRFLG